MGVGGSHLGEGREQSHPRGISRATGPAAPPGILEQSVDRGIASRPWAMASAESIPSSRAPVIDRAPSCSLLQSGLAIPCQQVPGGRDRPAPTSSATSPLARDDPLPSSTSSAAGLSPHQAIDHALRGQPQPPRQRPAEAVRPPQRADPRRLNPQRSALPPAGSAHLSATIGQRTPPARPARRRATRHSPPRRSARLHLTRPHDHCIPHQAFPHPSSAFM